MKEIQYIGEHLIYGQIGHFLVVLSFAASIFAALSYFFAVRHRNEDTYQSWLSFGRMGFWTHLLCVFGIIGIIFFIMINKYYEYSYVFQHVSEDLPFKYIFSAFWEGQEGSFLLWMFWHVILGAVLIFKAGKWEAPVLFCILFVEIFIGTMILGLHFGEYKVGSSPMVLFRDTAALPLFAKEDYVMQLAQFADGLNPLLQNYWMTIHPPTLFLGFASTIVPFAYAIAGLWTKEHKAWLQPALKWALFSGGILGTGILMGAAWAYEALTFGGYWAWDPVENTSLVPWLVMVAGIHTNLIARSTGYSIKSSYLFYCLSFLLIVYSTTLTRSGVLGDTSVHAFTEMGLENQLLIFIIGILALCAYHMIKGFSSVPSPPKEEAFFSKEFWMFIGSLVLIFSSVLITFTSSIPVYNKIAGLFDIELGLTSPLEPVKHYNKYQLWIAVFIGLFSAFAQYLRYREINWDNRKKKVFLHAGICLLLSALLSYFTVLWIEVNAWQYKLMMFFAYFTVFANLDVLLTYTRYNKQQLASFISHGGFGFMIIGILASGLNQKHISTNPFAQRGLLRDDMLGKNVLLLKDSPMHINGYKVTYQGDSIVANTRYFNVNYQRIDEMGNTFEEFNLAPNALYDSKFTKIASYNPSTKRYLTKDIFSHIAGLAPGESDIEEAKAKEDSLNWVNLQGLIGEEITFRDTVEINTDSSYVKEFIAEITGINKKPEHPEYQKEDGDIALGVKMNVQWTEKEEVFEVEPVIVVRSALLYNYPAQINELALKVKLNEATLSETYLLEDQLNYQDFQFKQGEQINFNGHKITFTGYNQTPEHPDYIAAEGDIAVSAIMQVGDVEDALTANPVFLIRGNRPFNLKDEIESMGLHFRFVKIDPNTGKVFLSIAKQDPPGKIPFDIATNSFRTDYIVLEAIEFPGINLFWLGTIMMMLGLFVGMFMKFRKVNAV